MKNSKERSNIGGDMKVFCLNEMTRGWFVGNFEPSVLVTNEVEVAVKRYEKGAYEAAHFHKVATEITVILSGRVFMCGQEFQKDAILVLTPGEVTDFTALEDSVCVVVKYPGAINDKYMEE